MRIAVIGSGISGLGAALALSETHDVTVFESASRLGGHANTVSIDYPLTGGGTKRIDVDTGFIVYNRKTYPNLCALFEHLGTETEWSDMSLGFSIDNGRVEWAADNFNTIFAQRRNLLNLPFMAAMREVLKFNADVKRALAEGDDESLSLADWLDQKGYSRRFRWQYLYPMAGAIWSTRSGDIADFSAMALFRFYENHDLLTGLGEAVQWRTVTGGSRQYVSQIADRLGERVRLNAEVVAVEEGVKGATVRLADGSALPFDQVIMTTHSDDALRLRTGADEQVRALLSAIPYAPNKAYLHRDPSLMPMNKRVWSSWSTLTGGDAESKGASLSYWMNRLQNIDRGTPLFVTLNPAREPDPALTFGVSEYAHPQFSAAAFEAQRGFDAVQGRGNIWHAGAWLGYGFHEDGLRSAMRVVDALGARPSWCADLGTGPISASQRLAAE